MPSAAEFSAGEPGTLMLDLACAPSKPLLCIIRRMIACAAESIGFDDDDLLKIEMAVDEACTNAFVHAYPDGAPKRGKDDASCVEVRLLIDPQALTIQIRDYGPDCGGKLHAGIDSLTDYAHPDRDGYHGLGILIMKQFMDVVEFSSVAQNGTLVTLRKILKPGAAGLL